MSVHPSPPLPPPPLPPAPSSKGSLRRPVIIVVMTTVVLAIAAVGITRSTRTTARTMAFSFSPKQSIIYLVSRSTHDEYHQGSRTPVVTDTSMTGKEQWAVATMGGEKGTALAVTQSDVGLTTNGTSSEPADVKTAMSMLPTGRIWGRDTLTSDVDQVATLNVDQVTPLLPTEAVAPGDTWHGTYTEPLPFGAGDITVESQSTYVRDERSDGMQVALIRGEVAVPFNYSLTVEQAQQTYGTFPIATKNADQLAIAKHAYRGFSMFYRGSVHVTITTLFDTRTGEMVHSTLEFTNTLAESVGKGDFLIPGTTIQDQSHSSMTFTRV